MEDGLKGVEIIDNGIADKYTDAEAVAAVNAAGLILADNKRIKLEETLAADHTACGIICDGVAGATVAFGQLLYLAVADSRWEKADADAEATTKPLLGICLSSGDDGDAILLLLIGFFRDDSITITKGAPVFVSCSVGEVTSTAPSGSGDCVRVVGHGHDDTHTIFFNPSGSWVEIT